MSSISHDDNTRLSAAFGDGRRTAQCAKRGIVASTQRPRALGKQCGKVDPADARHGFENHDVLSLKTVSGCGVSFADHRTDLIELTFGFPQLTVYKPQTSDQRPHVNARRFSNTIRNFDGWFSQSTENGLGIHAADA